MDASSKTVLDVACARCNSKILVSYVILHTRLLVDFELDRLHWWSKSLIILPSIGIVGIVLGIIDVLLWSINPKPFFGDLELGSCIAKGEKREDPDKDPDGGRLYAFQRAYVNSLAVVSKPITKVNTFDHHRGPLMASDKRHRLEHVFDVSMPPIMTFNLRNRSLQ